MKPPLPEALLKLLAQHGDLSSPATWRALGKLLQAHIADCPCAERSRARQMAAELLQGRLPHMPEDEEA